MTEIEIIKALFKAYAGRIEVVVTLENAEMITGVVSFFDGEKVTVGVKDLPISAIANVQDYVAEVLTDNEVEKTSDITKKACSFVEKIVSIKLKECPERIIEGLLCAEREEEIVVISLSKKWVLRKEDILDILEIHDEKIASVGFERELNEFEKALLVADKDAVISLIENEEKMLSLGYSSAEIANMLKKIKLLPWTDDDKNREYNQARRIYEIQNNRSNIAYTLFVDFLNLDKGSIDSRAKAINSVLEILRYASGEDVFEFCEKYKEILIQKEALCYKVATILISKGMKKQARLLAHDIANVPEDLFNIDMFSSDVTHLEIYNYWLIPNKLACKKLLLQYSNQNRQEEFFSLVGFLLPEIREDVDAIEALRKQFRICDGEFLNEYLAHFPLLWMDSDIASRYIELNSERIDLCGIEKRLMEQCHRAIKYEKVNELEEALVRSDFKSFEVLRSNNSILFSYGYDAEEIVKIRAIDATLLQKKTIFERLLMIEGNRNFIAESLAWKDFLRMPKNVCSELFPLLLSENNGGLLYELFNYSVQIREQLKSLKPLYLKALMLLEEKEEFWIQVKDEWLSLESDSELLVYAIAIAEEKGELQLVSAMTVYSQMANLNEFELALANGSATKIRTIIADVNNLTEMGYNSEEISLILESIHHRIDFRSDNKLAIANRIFAFQKNKNKVAELYYKLALLDGEVMAAYGLFSVFENEGRFDELCNVFASYLKSDENMITTQMRGSYLHALYELRRFNEFIEYYNSCKEDAVINPIILLEVLLVTKSNSSDINGVLTCLNEISSNEVSILKRCIKICLSSLETSEHIKYAIMIFNSIFEQLEVHDVVELTQMFETIDEMSIPQPMGNGVLTLIVKRDSYLKEWCEYLRQRDQDEKTIIKILEKIDAFVASGILNGSDVLSDMVLELYQSKTMIPESLEKYLIPELSNDKDKVAWLEKCLESVSEIDELKFTTFCKFSNELGEIVYLRKLIYALSKEKNCKILNLKKVIIDLINTAVEKKDNETMAVLLDAILDLAGSYQLHYKDVLTLYKAYMLVGNNDYAYIADKIIGNNLSFSDDDNRQIMALRRELHEKVDLSLFTVVERELFKIRDCRIVELLCMWKGLFRITEEDTLASEELRDYYNTPEKWSAEAKDLLVKHLFCNYKSELYWKLIKQYYSNSEDEIKLNIEYQYAKTKPDLFGSVIMVAQKQKSYDQLLDVINYLLAESDIYVFDKCYRYIYRTLYKCPGIFASSEMARKYMQSLFGNENLCNNGNALRFVLEVSECAGIVSEFAEKYISFNEVYDYLFIKKVLCKVLLEEKNNESIAEDIISKLKQLPHEIAYLNMLIDMWVASNYDGEVNRVVLQIIQRNEQETIDEQLLYRLYTKAVSCEYQSVFMKAIEQIEKYYPKLSVYDDLKKYELTSKAVEDNQVLEIYEDEFSQLVNILDPDRMLKTIINMLPGDIFLARKNINHDSVYDYGLLHLSVKELEELEFYYELYTSVCDALNEDGEFLCIFMKACFLRQWKEVVEYKTSHQYINDILKRDHSVKKLLLKRHYEVLKWVFLSLLDIENDDENKIERAYTLLSAASIVRFNKGTLRRFYKMDDHYREIVRKIFSIRIESATLRNLGYVGEAILEIDDNEKVAYLICTLPYSDLCAIFNNEMCFEALMNLPLERSQHITEVYVGLFSEGRDNVFSRVIANIQSNNIVSDLSNNPYNEDDSIKFLREKYKKHLENIERAGADVSNPILKKFELAKAEYLHYAVMNDSVKDLNEINPSRMDYISVVTMLFNKKDVKDIKDFVWKLSKDKLLPLYSYTMQLLDQYVVAYKILNLIEDEEWKKTLLQVQYRAMGVVSLKKEEKEIRTQIKKSIDADRSYWLWKFWPLTEEQVPVYLDKIKALHSFVFEFKDFLVFNGEEVDDVDLDEEKFVEDLRNIENKYSKKIKAEGPVKEEQSEGSIECVADYLDNDILVTMLSCSNVEPISNMEHTPLTYEECIGAIKFFTTVKRESRNKRDISSFKNLVRWAFLKKMDEEGYTRDKLLGVLKLITKDDLLSKSQWIVIVSYLVKYFDSIENLSQMSRMLENDLPLIRVLASEDNQKLKLFRKGELKVWKNIESILSEISGVDYLRLDETEQLQHLSSYRSKLLANGNEKESSAFLQINNKILRLINNQITGLKNSAELVINVLEENRNQEVSIVWEKNNNIGYLYAVISNEGGTNCEKVTLVSKINVSKTRRFEINKIYPGEKIPFRETFRASDLKEGRLNWDIEVSYFDSNKDKKAIVMYHITVYVSIGNDILNLGNISTGNPAKGKDFVGRTRELALLRNRYSDDEQLPSMLIRGLRRSGKSSILIQLTEFLKNKNQFVVVFVDGQSVGEDIKNAFIDKVINGIRISYRNVKEYKEIIENELNEFKNEWKEKMDQTDWIGQLDLFYFELSQLLGKKILVIIDEMESIFYNHRFESIAQEKALYAALRALIQKTDNYVSFVFCGSDTLLSSCLEQRSETQMFQTLQYLEVGHMNHGDIQEIFRRQSEKYEINFSHDAVETIWEYTDGLVWYAKLLGYLVINNIFAKDFTIRKEVNRWDIIHSVQMLINGEIGTDKYDLVDACLNTSRTAIVHAMAGIMPDYNKEVSIDEILISVKMMKMEGYINPRNGEEIPNLNEESIKAHLEFLEKMQFVEPNATKTKYKFTAELYRLFFRKDKKLHLFEERGIQ